MDLTTEHQGNQFTAFLSGQLKYQDNTEFRRLIEEINAAKVRNCVFDLSQLTAIDSAGLGMLVIASDNSETHGWEIVLRGVKGQVRKVLDLSRFDKLMTVIPDPSGE
ncbi:STAS domain-containing protein [Roseibium limicola]|uniref:Anti-sigma factor antagonist n=1 Tax=Roseibium limicola TaxID=2816037 RepID=A0A939EQ99_9HYPH|nr:STAS domain-containing protein [Roseibium limicola]MBO0346543.1 STAS domain-containing protein [Roseibium limicola]